MGKTESMAEAKIAEDALSKDGSDTSSFGGGSNDLARVYAEDLWWWPQQQQQ